MFGVSSDNSLSVKASFTRLDDGKIAETSFQLAGLPPIDSLSAYKAAALGEISWLDTGSGIAKIV